MRILFALFAILVSLSAAGQTTCTAPGQNPGTAFPVCGTSTFTQTSVPLCGGRQVPNSACSNVPLSDVNPFWYKFTCFKSGTLGFRIKPHTNSEDYDWQLFDITGLSPDAVYTTPNIVVASNWSGEGGETGASSAGNNLMVCDGLGKPLWSKMPQLIEGHEYLLLVSHFTQTQSGYDLSFGGGTAVITDTTPPALKTAETNCGGTAVRVKLNKRMKCASIAANGSDFFITPGNIQVTSAQPANCVGFDTDSVILQLSGALPPGNYALNVKQGIDNNTVLDYCDNAIPETDKVDFIVLPVAPTPMDSIAPVQCAPQSVKLVFKKPILCSSVAANGSDFMIAGTYPVTVTAASANCTAGNNYSKEILIHFNGPLQQAGNFSVVLQNGTDGNTIIDECALQTPPGSSVDFQVGDTVNASFSYVKTYGCTTDTVRYAHPGNNGVSSWQWSLDEGKISVLQNPQALYNVFTNKNVRLIVSNGFCADTSTQTIVLADFIKADFTTYEDNCPNEVTDFTGSPTGRIVTHHWSFGDGNTSALPSPSHTYSAPLSTTPFVVRYTVTDSLGCSHTASKTIKIYSSCYLAVPSAFTPNNDGKNDFLYPLNAIKAEQLNFRVYNRWGQLMFETRNWKQGWDGRFKGMPQPSGMYVWYLTYVDRDTKEPREMKGTTVLIR